MRLAAGFCTHWLIILHCCTATGFAGSGAGAAQPTLLQCSSAFHWLTLQLCLCAAPRPLKNTSRGWGVQRGDGSTDWNGADKGENCHERSRRHESKSFRRVSDTADHTHCSSYTTVCWSGWCFFFSPLAIGPSFPTSSSYRARKAKHPPATVDLVFPFHTPTTRATCACALIFLIQSHHFQMPTRFV